MRQFRRDLSLFLGVQVVVGLVVLAAHRPDDRAYLAATLDKHALLETRARPLLVVVGGSNAAFGLDSELLAARLPGYHVVNLGLHAGLGLEFMLAEAEPTLGPGDVLVISPEYQHFAQTRKDLLVSVLEQRPRSIASVPLRYLPEILDRGLTEAGRVIRETLRRLTGGEPPGPPYSRASFNAFGDVVAHRGRPAAAPVGRFTFIGLSASSVRATANRIDVFAARCQARGVRVYLVWPPIPEPTFRQHQASLDLIQTTLATELRVPMLNQPADAAFDQALFYDSYYHLTSEGTRRRTEALATALRVHLAGQPGP